MSSLIVEVCEIENILPHANADALETVKQLSEGSTSLAADHIREGVVVKPLRERTDPKSGRVCLKYIGDPYLFAKNVSDSHDV